EFKQDKAKAMITEGKHSIGYIASAVGFANAGHFSRCFKKKFGLLPKDFRREYFAKTPPHQA
ncbi:MAG: helix-turn-helix domain-containing protein, partial [Bacteroidota bacterium]